VQIGNFLSESIFYKPVAAIKSGAAESLTSTLGAADTAHIEPEVTLKYDLGNISPREIDQMAKELRQRGLITDTETFALLKFGAEYLSSQPGNTLTEEKLDQKADLFGQLEQQIADEKAAGNPVEAHKNLLEFIQKLEARNGLPVAGIIA
jgi:hypothetical protein